MLVHCMYLVVGRKQAIIFWLACWCSLEILAKHRLVLYMQQEMMQVAWIVTSLGILYLTKKGYYWLGRESQYLWVYLGTILAQKIPTWNVESWSTKKWKKKDTLDVWRGNNCLALLWVLFGWCKSEVTYWIISACMCFYWSHCCEKRCCINHK